MLRFGESIQEILAREGMSRRDFLKFCSVMAGALALPRKERFSDRQSTRIPTTSPCRLAGTTRLCWL